MTGVIKKAKGVWHYAKYAFWGIRTNAKPKKQIAPKREFPDDTKVPFKNSSMADIIRTNIEARADGAEWITSNTEFLLRMKEKRSK